MNAKIERVSKDIQKTKDKINEFQLKLRELEKHKTEKNTGVPMPSLEAIELAKQTVDEHEI